MAGCWRCEISTLSKFESFSSIASRIPICHIRFSVEKWYRFITWIPSTFCPGIWSSATLLTIARICIKKTNVYFSIGVLVPCQLCITWITLRYIIICITIQGLCSICICKYRTLLFIINIPRMNHWSWDCTHIPYLIRPNSIII